MSAKWSEAESARSSKSQKPTTCSPSSNFTSLPQLHLRFGAPVNFKRSHAPPVSPRSNVAATMMTPGRPNGERMFGCGMTDHPRRSYCDSRVSVPNPPPGNRQSKPAGGRSDQFALSPNREEEAMKTSAALMAFCAAVSVLGNSARGGKVARDGSLQQTMGRHEGCGQDRGQDLAELLEPMQQGLCNQQRGRRHPCLKPAKAEKTLKTVAATHNEDDTAQFRATEEGLRRQVGCEQGKDGRSRLA